VAHHQVLPIGSQYHKAALKMLKRERVGRRAIRHAARSENFIFMSPLALNMENPIEPTGVAFHELGHGFSETAGLHAAHNRSDNEVGYAIHDYITKGSDNLDEFFETRTLIDENGVQQVISSKAESLMDLHLQQMRDLAIEEARAEGFAHRMLERTIRPNDSHTLLDRYIPAAEQIAKKQISKMVKESMENGKTLSANIVPGMTLGESVSYSKGRDFIAYANRTINPFKDAIEKKYGKEALDDPRIKQFIDDLMFKGKVQGQKTLLESIDSPIVSRVTRGVEGVVEWTMDTIKGKYGQEEIDYYAREMGEMLAGMPINRSGEIAAQASMTNPSILSDLLDDALGASSAVLKSAESTEKQIVGTISGRMTRPITISATQEAAGAAIVRASRSSTTSRIISGMKSAMKVVGTLR
jgi:hypothetical protein